MTATRSVVRRLLIDVHTHVYLPRYVDVLRARKHVPLIHSWRSAHGVDEDRLVLFEHEPPSGRPIGPQFWDLQVKLDFMDTHGIDISVVSPANPWLDFLAPSVAADLAVSLNSDLDSLCASSPSVEGTSLQRLYAFGVLPLCPDVTASMLVDTIHKIAALSKIRGVIVGSRGLGEGLDDPRLEPLWSALAENNLVVFLHPHYGVGEGSGESAFGKSGHVLPLALGFPFETTIAITRLILAGTLDRHPNLKILLAHAGGTLPILSSRLASCIAHDPSVKDRLKYDARYYLGRLYYDAVAYGAEELGFVTSVVDRAQQYGEVGNDTALSGSSHILFGTDHPFFPPPDSPSSSEGPSRPTWRSVTDNLNAIDCTTIWSAKDKEGVRCGNALKLLGLEAP